MAITLYDLAAADPNIRFSPFCWRSRFSLLHKGLDHKTVAWRFTEKNVLAPSGQGRVPVIIDHGNGDRCIHDSWQIARYLDETYPDRPLMPSVESTVHARFIAAWAETAVHAAAFPLVITHLHAQLDARDQVYFRESREQRFGKTLEALRVDPKAGVDALQRALAPAEQALTMASFLGGAHPTYADYALAGSLMWVWVTSPVAPLDPATATGRWFASMLDLHGGIARTAPLMR